MNPLYRSAKEEKAEMNARHRALGAPCESTDSDVIAAHRIGMAAVYRRDAALARAIAVRDASQFEITKDPDWRHAKNVAHLGEQVSSLIALIDKLTREQTATANQLEKATEALAAAKEAFNSARKASPRADAHTYFGQTRGALGQCVSSGACSVQTADEAANGCQRPAYARDSAEGEFIVWGHGTGASWPGVPSKTCACGKHEQTKKDEKPASSAAAARAEMIAHNQSLSGAKK